MDLSVTGAERCHSGSTSTDTKVLTIFSVALLPGAPQAQGIQEPFAYNGNITLALTPLCRKTTIHKHGPLIPLPSELRSGILFLLRKRRNCFRGQLLD